MRVETLLRKLHLQEALSDDELNAFLEKIGPDGLFPPDEIPILLAAAMQRPERLSIEDIKAVSGLACGEAPAAEKGKEDMALREIVSKLSK